MRGLYLKGICAVGDIGHCLHALLPHGIHGGFEGVHLVFNGRRIPHLIDLVYETGHARSFAELTLKVRKFHMAVGIYKAGADNAFLNYLRWAANASFKHSSVLPYLNESVGNGLTRQGVN